MSRFTSHDTGGLQVYYDLIRTWQDRYRRADEKVASHDMEHENEHEEHGASEQNDGDHTPPSSNPSVEQVNTRDSSEDHHSIRHKVMPSHLGHQSMDLLKKSLHNSHHHLHPPEKPKPVGLWETLTRANLEGRLISRKDRQWINDVCPRLGPASQRLLRACEVGTAASARSIRKVNKQRVWTSLGLTFDITTTLVHLFQKKGPEQSNEEPPKDIYEATSELKAALEEYRSKERHAVIEPYRSYFDQLAELNKSDSVEFSIENLSPPPHRALFYSLLYEFQL